MKSSIKFSDLIEVIEHDYPVSLAESWDQVGIHFGNPNDDVRRVMAVLDIRENTLREAILNQVDTLIVHHPPIFKPIQRFNTARKDIALYEKLIKHGIKVYAMHTNFDVALDGMNDWLCEALGLVNISSLMFDADDNNPKIGRIGQFHRKLSRYELIQKVKDAFNLEKLTVIESQSRSHYQNVAIVGGSGVEFAENALAQEADVFITGDIKYHDAQYCEDLNMMTIDAGHYIEAIFSEKMYDKLIQWSQRHDWSIDIVESQESTNPFTIE